MGIWELNWPERLKSHEPSPMWEVRTNKCWLLYFAWAWFSLASSVREVSPKSLSPKPLDKESERQKLFCKLPAVLNKAASNKRTDEGQLLKYKGESCLPWIKRTREEDLGRAGESTQWNLHLQTDSSVTDSGWVNKDIQWLTERQRQDNYYWTQDASYHAGHKKFCIEGDCIYQGAQAREREKSKYYKFLLVFHGPCWLG